VNTLLVTPAFRAWLRALRDPTAKARILARIRSAEAVNFGDDKGSQQADIRAAQALRAQLDLL
jgi:putative component of toxin-antitoxin plasmid stabilization module